MSVHAATDLRSLTEHPFDLLQEIERRSKVAMAGAAGENVNVEEWVGIGFRLHDERFIVNRESIREVLMVPSSMTRVPGAKSWIRGLANVRGHLLPVADLRLFLGGGVCEASRSARILVVNSHESPTGFIVDEVFGFRRFLDGEHENEAPQTVIRCERFLDGSFHRGEDVWPVFIVDRLLESKEFQHAAEE